MTNISYTALWVLPWSILSFDYIIYISITTSVELNTNIICISLSLLGTPNQLSKCIEDHNRILIPKPKWCPKHPGIYNYIDTDDIKWCAHLHQFITNCVLVWIHHHLLNDPIPSPSFHYIGSDDDKKELDENLVIIFYIHVYWSVFREGGVTITIHVYNIIIDTCK